jgi:uncharacterized membrane protein
VPWSATTAARRVRAAAPFLLAGLFTASGVLHLVRPAFYVGIVPDALPEPEAIVRLSGIVELVCAAGLVARRPWAAWASVALLLAVFPANVQHAVHVVSDRTSSPLAVAGVLLRLPLQLPLIWAALQARRR